MIDVRVPQQVALLALMTFVTASAKFLATTVTLDERGEWQYFSKFAVDVGTGKYLLRARFISPVVEQSDEEWPFHLAIYLDTQWDEALSQYTCDGKLRSARIDKLLTVPRNGEWSDQVSGALIQRVRPYFWYFVLADCRQELQEQIRLKVEIVTLNVDDSHYSLEDRNLGFLYLGALLVFLGTLCANGLVMLRRFRKVERMERPLLLLNSSVAAQIASIVCALVHYWVYSSNGKGVTFLDFLSQGLNLMSQLTITVILLLVSSGWTISYSDLPGLETSVPAMLLLMLVEFFAAGMSRLWDESYDKYSEFDGASGLLIVALRLSLFALFVVNSRKFYSASQGTVKTVVIRFSVIASLYFLAVPCISLASRVFAQYLRNKIVLASNFAMQLLAFVTLARLFGEHSLYHKVSTFSDSVLPWSKLR